ncbi:hypothetical protein [Chryseobacterium tongliaoense]|uniref:hypothetical protein n=1 Tax=Chryseobacterium tongliaoense TaxID=3240933 RepID=UPI00351923CB
MMKNYFILIFCSILFLSITYKKVQFTDLNLKKEQTFAASKDKNYRKIIFAGVSQPGIHDRDSAAENGITEIPAPDPSDQLYESNIDMYVPALLIIGLILILYFSKTGIYFKSRY